MNKFRAALVTAVLAVSLVGGTAGAMSSNTAAKDSGNKVVKTMKDGGGWCC